MDKMNLYNLEWVRLINFQLHEDSTFHFTDGLNVITGVTGTGKTGIFRGIEWLYGFSKISENDYRKEGTKSTSVIVKLKSGFEVEKIRSSTLNRYILRKEDCEDKVFDSVGKDVPEEVKQVLGIYELEFDKISLNVNFASQDDLNFIFDSQIPGSFNAKLFNKLTGNELLDTLFKECNRESLSINRDLKSLDEQIIKQEEDVKNCTKQYNELQKKLNNVKNLYSQIEEKIIIYDELKKMASKLKENKEADDFVKFKLSKIVTISEKTINKLKEKAELLKNLASIQSRLKEVKSNLDKTIEEQKLIKIPEIDFDTLKEDNLMLTELTKLSDKLSQNKKGQKNVTQQLVSEQMLLGTLEKQLKEVWDKCKVCPLCKKQL